MSRALQRLSSATPINRVLTRLQHRNVRAYEVLRTAHLERARTFAPASILYRTTRYDFDSTLTEGLDLVACGYSRLVVILSSNRVDRLEINEPLARGGLLMGACAVAAVRIGGLVRRRRTAVVSYAIENLNPFSKRPIRLKSRVRYSVEMQLSHWLAGQVDQIAFGTSGAQELYAGVFGGRLAGTEARLVPALPAACSCLTPESSPRDGSVTFLGSFDARKGITELMAAWDLVASARPDARLTVIGKGPLLATVADFVAAHPSASLVVDPPREQIHQQLRSTSLLVLLSQPSATWREQVGLPIVEGLSHGATVLTTTQTGLADWLASHGHVTIDAAATPEVTAAAIVQALQLSRPAESVLADLPELDGRQLADQWLMADDLERPTAPSGVS
ncbi:MAG: glycosyltransferase [Propionibacteriaceae bacterium]